MKGISSFPVMSVNGSILLDLAGNARRVQLMTCAHNATWQIATITGTRLSVLTRAGARGEFGTKE